MTRRRLTIDVDATPSKLEGEVRDEDAGAHPFTGWLGLAAALEEALGESVHRPAVTDRPVVSARGEESRASVPAPASGRSESRAHSGNGEFGP